MIPAPAHARKQLYTTAEASLMIPRTEAWFRMRRMKKMSPAFVVPTGSRTALYPFASVVAEAEKIGVKLRFFNDADEIKSEISLAEAAKLARLSLRTLQIIKNSKGLKFPAPIAGRPPNSPRYARVAVLKFFGLDVEGEVSYE